MANQVQSVRGTQDVLPQQSVKWQYLEKTAFESAALFGFREIRFPVMEHTELFQRGVGDTTDVVQKEMYTFDDRGGRSITLRPEGTACVVRSVVEHGLINEVMPLKVCYCGPFFRYDKPQAGRYRELHQFGVELFGANQPSADAEVILTAQEILAMLGVKNVSLEINSIGCPSCREKYNKKLYDYLSSREEELCATCRERMERNPMRIIDCKSPVCQEIAKNAPKIIDDLCGDCQAHFDGVKACLDAAGAKYTINPDIVRGLDYYTRTVFEFLSGEIGAQSAVCGGGRYSGLVKQLGGPDVEGVGFGMGLERVLLVMENQGNQFPLAKNCDVYIGSIGDKAAIKAFELATSLREEGFAAECDIVGRSVKAQMKYADKIGAAFTMILGENELEGGTANLKNMQTKEIREVDLGEGVIKALYDVGIAKAMDDLSGSISGEISEELLAGMLGGSISEGK